MKHLRPRHKHDGEPRFANPISHFPPPGMMLVVMQAMIYLKTTASVMAHRARPTGHRQHRPYCLVRQSHHTTLLGSAGVMSIPNLKWRAQQMDDWWIDLSAGAVSSECDSVLRFLKASTLIYPRAHPPRSFTNSLWAQSFCLRRSSGF